LKDVRPDVPSGVVALIERMMSKKKEDRPADAQAVANELKSLLRQATGKETPPSEAAFRPGAAATRGKRPFLERPLRQQMWWMIGASVLVMASTAGIGWAMRTPDPFKTPITAQSKVLAQSTVEGQIYRAQGLVGKPGVSIDEIEAAWIEVKTHPGATDKDKHRADLNLALIYLKTKRQKQAEEIFHALDATTDSWGKAHGKAGLAILASLTNPPDLATFRKLADQAHDTAKQSDGTKSLDPAMDEALNDAIRRSKGSPQ